MKQYLLLRLRTQVRQWAELGWWRALLLTGLGAAAARQAWLVLATQPIAQWLLPPLLALLIGGAHRGRPDLAFLQLTAPGYRRWLMAEYALAGSLPAATLLSLGNWPAAILAVVLPTSAAWLPAATVGVAHRHRSLVRSEAFEWVSGMRQRLGWLVWAGLLAGAAWQRHVPVAPALCLVAWLLVTTSFYDTPEPEEMLLASARSAGQWLRRRLLWANVYLLLTMAPFLGPMAWGEAGLGGAALLLVWATLVLSMVVLAKYTFYPNATIICYAQGGVVALSLLMLANAVYVALMAATLLGLIWRSRYRLAQYRYD